MTGETAGHPPATGGEGGLPSYADLPVRGFLGELAAARPAPAAGSAAALTVALAAALCEKAARLAARQLGESTAQQLAAAARRVGGRCGELVQADAAAYSAVIDAIRADRAGDPGGPRAAAAAMAAAADPPLRIIEAAAQIAPLAERLAADGNPNLRGDAVTAALLAHGAARAAAVLMRINLTGAAAGDGRLASAARLLAEIDRCHARLHVDRRF